MSAFHTIRGQYEDHKITAAEALQQIESAILANEMSLTDRNEALAWAGNIVEGVHDANPLSLDELREINDDADFYFAA